MAATQQQQPAINNKAAAWTIGVHALLLLLFILCSYTIAPLPVTPVDSMVGGGLEVNLGTSDNGSGNNQPMSKKDPAEYQASVVYKTVAAQSSLPQHIAQSNNDDDPSVNNESRRHGNASSNEAGRPRPNPRYVYPGASGQGGNNADQNRNGRNEGNTTGPGDRGVLGGTPGAPNYTGTPGNGTGGIGHTLSGRHISPDQFEAEFHEGGKVVIHVTVDRDGTIVSKMVKSSSSPQLTRIALDKLKDARFSKSNNSEPQQFGDVTIVFKTRQ